MGAPNLGGPHDGAATQSRRLSWCANRTESSVAIIASPNRRVETIRFRRCAGSSTAVEAGNQDARICDRSDTDHDFDRCGPRDGLSAVDRRRRSSGSTRSSSANAPITRAPALLQVSDTQGVLLVDPTTISDYDPLAEVLTSPAVVVVMHACGEDLEVLEVMTGTTPRRIFDTQLAAAFAGHRFSLGYRDLVATLLDISLDKGETRSNWLRRPLSPSQLHYAALDVLYLLPCTGTCRPRWTHCNEAPGWMKNSNTRDVPGRRQPARSVLSAGTRSRCPLARPSCRAAPTQRLARHRGDGSRHASPTSAPRSGADRACRHTGTHRRTSNPCTRHVRPGPAAATNPPWAERIRAALAEGPTEADYPINLRPHTDTLTRLRDIARQAAGFLACRRSCSHHGERWSRCSAPH